MIENTGSTSPSSSEESAPTGGKHPSTSKKPFYKKKWFIALAIIVVLIVIGSIGGNSNNGSNQSGSESAATSTTSPSSSEKSSEESTPAAESAAPTVDKSGLQSAVDLVNTSTNDGYTEDSWNAVLSAASDGQKVLDDTEATQSQVDKAEKAIDDAIAALKEEFNPDNYQTPAYNDVARTPDDWKSTKVSFTGRVLQVVEGTDETDLRIATDGKYDDIIMVGYDPSIMNGTRVLEDDSVTIYGTCIGLYTYTSTLGASISIPGIYADQVVIN